MLPVMNTIRDDLGEDETMVTQAQVLNLLLDWTNPENQLCVIQLSWFITSRAHSLNEQ